MIGPPVEPHDHVAQARAAEPVLADLVGEPPAFERHAGRAVEPIRHACLRLLRRVAELDVELHVIARIVRVRRACRRHRLERVPLDDFQIQFRQRPAKRDRLLVVCVHFPVAVLQHARPDVFGISGSPSGLPFSVVSDSRNDGNIDKAGRRLAHRASDSCRSPAATRRTAAARASRSVDCGAPSPRANLQLDLLARLASRASAASNSSTVLTSRFSGRLDADDHVAHG